MIELISDLVESEPVSKDRTEFSQRDFIWTRTIARHEFRIVLSAELDEAEAVCQRVITGTKKTTKGVYVEVDEPVYEFKC